MRTYSATGIVLRRNDLAEKDRILVIYTKERGKISAVAKGARRPGSRLGGASEPFTCSRFFLSTGRNMDVVTQAETRESFPNVKSSVKTIAYGIYLLEMINHFADEGQANADLFDTLLSSMYVLEGGTSPEITARHFELSVLDILGYKPHFEACLRCSSKTIKGRTTFSPSMGGVICPECGTPPQDAIWVPAAVASYIHALEVTPPNKLKDLTFPKAALRDIGQLLKWHIRYRLERTLKSADFIEAVAHLDGDDA